MVSMKTKRRALRIAVAAVLLILAAGGGFYYFWHRAAVYGKIQVVKPFEYTVSPVMLGDEFLVRAVISVPWGQSLEGVELEIPKDAGVIQVGKPQLDDEVGHWGKRYYSVNIPLLAYRTGELDPGRAKLAYRRDRALEPVPDAMNEMALPPVKVEPRVVSPDEELPLAGELRSSQMKTNYRWLWVAVPVAAALLFGLYVLYRLLRRKTAEWLAPPTAWELALEELHELRGEAHSGYPAQCFARLSDIVRRYIERRFLLPSTTTTTPEFLRAMRGADSPLTPPQQHKLGDFLAVADMVKFAKMEPDEATVDNSIFEAENFVKSTVPAPKVEVRHV
ncbi:MAG: hypothetical protein AB7F40_03090 [Victivallaceae bacterium]|nr:hypothetical protein [Victivallaceae bacterium]